MGPMVEPPLWNLRKSALPILYQAAMRGCMLAGSDRATYTTRFDGPNDTSASSRLGRYGKAAG